MRNMRLPSKFYIMALLAVFIRSFNVIFAKHLSDTLLPWQIAFGRWVIAGGILLPFVIVPLYKQRAVLWHHKWIILASGLVGTTCFSTFTYFAAHTISAIEMSLINALGPVFLAVFSHIFLGITLNWKQYIGLVLTIIGITVVVSDGRMQNLEDMKFRIGDLWSLGTATCFGIYGLISAKKPSEITAVNMLGICSIIGCFFMIPFFVYDCYENPLTRENLTLGTIAIILYLGIANSLISYVFWNTALSIENPVKVGMLAYLMPILSIVEAYLILSEKIYISQILGGLVVFIGILLTNLRRRHIPALQSHNLNDSK